MIRAVHNLETSFVLCALWSIRLGLALCMLARQSGGRRGAASWRLALCTQWTSASLGWFISSDLMMLQMNIKTCPLMSPEMQPTKPSGEGWLQTWPSTFSSVSTAPHFLLTRPVLRSRSWGPEHSTGHRALQCPWGPEHSTVVMKLMSVELGLEPNVVT